MYVRLIFSNFFTDIIPTFSYNRYRTLWRSAFWIPVDAALSFMWSTAEVRSTATSCTGSPSAQLIDEYFKNSLCVPLRAAFVTLFFVCRWLGHAVLCCWCTRTSWLNPQSVNHLIGWAVCAAAFPQHDDQFFIPSAGTFHCFCGRFRVMRHLCSHAVILKAGEGKYDRQTHHLRE